MQQELVPSVIFPIYLDHLILIEPFPNVKTFPELCSFRTPKKTRRQGMIRTPFGRFIYNDNAVSHGS